MQSTAFPYDNQDYQVARNNLNKIVNDPHGLGGTNAGWCYLLAPLRTFITDPRFIGLLRRYKQKYFKNGQLTLNGNFICQMYAKNANEIANDIEAKRAIDVINTLCKHTDANGNLTVDNSQFCKYQLGVPYIDLQGKWHDGSVTIHSPYAGLIRLVHRVVPYSTNDSPQVMFDILRDCTAIMNENIYTLDNKWSEKIKNGNYVDLTQLEVELNNGKCITVGADGNHIFNIYKSGNTYYTTGGHQRSYTNLDSAIKSWSSQYHHLCSHVVEGQVDYFKKGRIEQYIKDTSPWYKPIRMQNMQRLQNMIDLYWKMQNEKIKLIQNNYFNQNALRIQWYRNMIQNQNNMMTDFITNNDSALMNLYMEKVSKPYSILANQYPSLYN